MKHDVANAADSHAGLRRLSNTSCCSRVRHDARLSTHASPLPLSLKLGVVALRLLLYTLAAAGHSRRLHRDGFKQLLSVCRPCPSILRRRDSFRSSVGFRVIGFRGRLWDRFQLTPCGFRDTPCFQALDPEI